MIFFHEKMQLCFLTFVQNFIYQGIYIILLHKLVKTPVYIQLDFINYMFMVVIDPSLGHPSLVFWLDACVHFVPVEQWKLILYECSKLASHKCFLTVSLWTASMPVFFKTVVHVVHLLHIILYLFLLISWHKDCFCDSYL